MGTTNWQRIPEGLNHEQPSLKSLLLPLSLDASCRLSTQDASSLLSEVVVFISKAMPSGLARGLTYEEQFKLRRTIECLMISGCEMQLLQIWFGEIDSACRRGANFVRSGHQEKSLSDLAAQLASLEAAVASLAIAAQPLDSVYTSKTPLHGTKAMTREAFKKALLVTSVAPPLSDDEPQCQPEDSFVASCWEKIRQRETAEVRIHRAEECSLTSASDVLTITNFLSTFDHNHNDVIRTSVARLLSTITETCYDWPVTSPISAAPYLVDISTRLHNWFQVAYPKTLTASMIDHFEDELSGYLFDAPSSSTSWLSRPILRPHQLPLLTLHTKTAFEWACLADTEAWTALAARFAASAAPRSANLLSAWGAFYSHTLGQIIDAHEAPADYRSLIAELLTWHKRTFPVIDALQPARSLKVAREAMTLAFKDRQIVTESFLMYLKALWAQGITAHAEYEDVLLIFTSLSHKGLIKRLLENALIDTILTVKSIDPSATCQPFIDLLSKECGEAYAEVMTAILVGCSETDEQQLSVKSIPSRLYNSHCHRDNRVIPKANECVIPASWSIPASLTTMLADYVAKYREVNSRRLLTFILEKSSAEVLDRRFGAVLTVSSDQFLVLNLFNSMNEVSVELIAREVLGNDSDRAVLVLESLKPLLHCPGAAGSFALTNARPAETDYRVRLWSNHGDPEAAKGASSSAAKHLINRFMELGLDALIMRVIKRGPQAFRLLKVAVNQHCAERFGSYEVDETALREHLLRLQERDLLTVSSDDLVALAV